MIDSHDKNSIASESQEQMRPPPRRSNTLPPTQSQIQRRLNERRRATLLRDLLDVLA